MPTLEEFEQQLGITPPSKVPVLPGGVEDELTKLERELGIGVTKPSEIDRLGAVIDAGIDSASKLLDTPFLPEGFRKSS